MRINQLVFPQLTSEPQNDIEHMRRRSGLLNENMVTGRHFTANRRVTKLYYMYKLILNVQCYSRVTQTDSTHVRVVKDCMEDAKTISLNNAKAF
jgi:hypothetical protein